MLTEDSTIAVSLVITLMGVVFVGGRIYERIIRIEDTMEEIKKHVGFPASKKM